MAHDEPNAFCEPALHDGNRVPAEWMLRRLEPIGSTDDHRPRFTPSDADWSTFAACGEHLEHALEHLTETHGAKQVLIRRANR